MKKVYVSYSCNDADLPLGTLFVDSIHGKDTYSFEFDPTALKEGYAQLLKDEDIAPVIGRQFKSDASTPYHFMEDSSPNRWGRNLLRKANGGAPLRDIDYLLGVSDSSRMGALRYRTNLDGPLLGDTADAPPYRFLREFESAAYSFDLLAKDERWKMLLDPGSSLGGTRPKASIFGVDKSLYLAKFASKNDDYNVPAVEYFTYLMAIRSGIEMSQSSLVPIGNSRSVFLTKRFDREEGKRIHYSSFMTILNAKDGDSSSYGYVDLAEAISALSATPEQDLRQLFLRAAFNLLMHNYDDHLRNHCMIYRGGKWLLSPAFDLNVSLDKAFPTLSIGNGYEGLDGLILASQYFGIAQEEGEKLVREMKQTLSRSLCECGRQATLTNAFIERLETLLFPKR